MRFGKVLDVTDPGLHFKVPVMDGIVKMSIRARILTEKLAVFSKDIRRAEIGMSVNYVLLPGSVSNVHT